MTIDWHTTTETAGPLQDDLEATIRRTELLAIGKSMCGQWSAADDTALADLYARRAAMR